LDIFRFDDGSHGTYDANRVDYFLPLPADRRAQSALLHRAGSGNDAHYLFADPLFVDEVAPDLHLQSGSPAIDVADPAFAPGEDFVGNSRPAGAGPDLGAHEAGLPNPTYLPHITIAALDASTLRLAWANDTVYEFYKVWRSEDPYFTPAGTPWSTVLQGPWRFDDAAALGEANSNHFYLVEGMQYDGGSTTSDRVGEFDFSLTAGG